MKVARWVSAAILAGLTWAVYRWSEDGAMGAILFGSLALVLVFAQWSRRSLKSGYEEEFVQQGEYFTPRLVSADRQLQALSARVTGDYKRGVLEWESFADRYALATTEALTPSPVWGRSSLVRKTVGELQVEVAFGVQPLDPGERGWRALETWFVLAPSVTVTVDTPNLRVRLNRYDANWSADQDIDKADRRLVSFVFGLAFSALDPPPMPPTVQSAREPLLEKASEIYCGPDHVKVIGRPLPRLPGQSREFGQGDFEVESLVDLVERTIAFVRALQNG